MDKKLIGFSEQKLKRLIGRHGKEFVFKRTVKNDFGEPENDVGEFFVKGIFHSEKSFLPNIKDENGTVHEQISPMILSSTDYVKEIEIGDFVEINNNKYTITAILNMTELNFAVNISLEREQDGKRN